MCRGNFANKTLRSMLDYLALHLPRYILFIHGENVIGEENSKAIYPFARKRRKVRKIIIFSSSKFLVFLALGGKKHKNSETQQEYLAVLFKIDSFNRRNMYNNNECV